MRGRKPTHLLLRAEDVSSLQQIARSHSLPWYQVRRARIVLAIAEGQRVQAVAQKMEWATRTVRRTGQIYETQGLKGLLKRVHRAGHPNQISPPAAGATGATSVLGTRG